MDAAHQNRSLPTGLAVSVALHALIIAFIAITFSHPQPLAPPSDLSNAIPISMEMYRPTPPPEPPKPVKPKTPKNVVTSEAPDAEMQASETPAEPSPPQQSQPAAPGTPSYASLVAGILQRNKRYPREALLNEQTGTVLTYFVINHQGHVIAYRIEQRSGVLLLDQEVLSLLKRVNFPPIPDDGGNPERREFTVPVVFNLSE